MLQIIRIATSSAMNQLIVGLTGFLIVQGLSKGDYAVYAITASFWGAITVISKAGINLGLGALLSRVYPDVLETKRVFVSAMAERYVISCIAVPFIAIVYALFLLRISTSWEAVIVLIIFILIYVGIDIRTKLQEQLINFTGLALQLQFLEISLNIIRLAAIALALHLVGTPLYLSIAITTIVGFCKIPFIDKWLAEKYEGLRTISSDEKYRLEIRRISRRQLPLEAFYIFQAQIVIYFASGFAGAEGTADLGALTRIGQLLVPVTNLSLVYFMPRFLKEKNSIARQYRSTLIYICVLSLIFPIVVALIPDAFLWLLGEKYSNLKRELIVYSIFAAFATMSGAAWQLAAHKGWNRYSMLQIPLFLVWIGFFFWINGMQSLLDIVYFQFGYPLVVVATTMMDIRFASKRGEL